jgi:peptide chain release factor 1
MDNSKTRLLERLGEAERKYIEIEQALASPDVISDVENYAKLSREHKLLTPVIEKYREYVATRRELEGAEELIRSESDSELRALAEEERQQCLEKLDRLELELKILLLPRDPNDERSVIVEIRGGAGGEEAALFAVQPLYRMYSMYAEKRGWKTEIVNLNETGAGRIKEVSFGDRGRGRVFAAQVRKRRAPRAARARNGDAGAHTHLDGYGRGAAGGRGGRAGDKPADLADRHVPLSGAGGQHVNKTESAIRDARTCRPARSSSVRTSAASTKTAKGDARTKIAAV